MKRCSQGKKGRGGGGGYGIGSVNDSRGKGGGREGKIKSEMGRPKKSGHRKKSCLPTILFADPHCTTSRCCFLSRTHTSGIGSSKSTESGSFTVWGQYDHLCQCCGLHSLLTSVRIVTGFYWATFNSASRGKKLDSSMALLFQF